MEAAPPRSTLCPGGPHKCRPQTRWQTCNRGRSVRHCEGGSCSCLGVSTSQTPSHMIALRMRKERQTQQNPATCLLSSQPCDTLSASGSSRTVAGTAQAAPRLAGRMLQPHTEGPLISLALHSIRPPRAITHNWWLSQRPRTSQLQRCTCTACELHARGMGCQDAGSGGCCAARMSRLA